jgi:hypothetical protein
VHEGGAERAPGDRPDRRVAGGGLGRLAQLPHTGVDRARPDGGLARLDHRARRGRPEPRGGGASRRHARGLVQLARQIEPELLAEEIPRRRQLLLHRGLVLGGREAPDEQHVRVGVQRIGGDEPGREPDRGGRLTGGERLQRALPQHRAAQGRDAATLREQPRVEAGGGLDPDGLEQLAPKPGQLDRRGRGSRLQHEHVDPCVGRQPELHGVPAADGVGPAEQPPELGEVPSQRVGGILGLGEEEIDQERARGGLLGEG